MAQDDYGPGFVTDEGTPCTTADVLANDGPEALYEGYDASTAIGLVSDNGDGTFDYDPDGQFEHLAVGVQATDTFAYTVRDGTGITDTAVVSITITGLNDAPTAVSDQGSGFVTDEDTPFATASALSNDSDPDIGNVLSVVSVNTSGTIGRVSNNGDGTFDYDPDGHFESLQVGEHAVDTFGYAIGDGHGSTDSATVTVTVQGRNDPPVAEDDTESTDEDTPLFTGDESVLTNDIDPENDPLRVSYYSRWSAKGARVVVGPDGSYSYDPTNASDLQRLPLGGHVVDTFTYTVSDDRLGTDMATVSITVAGVNDAPVAQDDTNSANEDDTLTVDAPGVLGNDDDIDGDLWISTAESDSTSHRGAAVIWSENGGYTYDPTVSVELQALADGISVEDQFDYTVIDGHGGSDTATVRITVAGRNDYPVAAAVALPGNSVDTLTLVTLDGSGSYDPDTGDTLTYLWAKHSGAPVAFDPTVVSPTFEAPNDPDVLIFTLTVFDFIGLADKTPATVVITVNNQSPVADAAVEPGENVTAGAFVTLDGSDSHDPDFDDLTFEWIQTSPIGVPVTLSDPMAPVATFTAPLQRTTLGFRLYVTDSFDAVASLPVFVSVDNRPPAAVAGVYPGRSVDTLTPVTLDGSESVDLDGDTPLAYHWKQIGGITVTLSNPYGETTAFTAPGDPTVLTFSLFVTDSLGLPANPLSDEVTITVNNRPPVADAGPDRQAGPETLVTLDGSSSRDLDNDRPLTYLWSQTGGTLVTLSNSHAVTATFAAPDVDDVLTFTLRVTDSWGLSALQSDEVVITVRPFYAYLPLIMRQYVTAPDLVVQAIEPTAQNVRVTIVNRGSAPVRDPFWVFVFVDPKTPPSAVNEVWSELGAKGMAWSITETDTLAALVPGGSLALNRGDRHYRTDDLDPRDRVPPDPREHVEWPLSLGMVLYAHVDAYEAGTDYGYVLETHEILGGWYNNILGPVVSSSALGTEAILSAKPRDIPARP